MVTQATQHLDDIAKICEANAIHTVELVFVDTWGIPRAKRLPVRQFLKGAGFAVAIAPLMWNPRCGIEDTSLATVGDGLPDIHATPDYDSFRVAGWEEGLGTVMCDLTDLHTHEAVPMASRAMLKRQLANFASEGMYPQVATELEFHLATANWEPLYNEIFCYSSDKATELEPIIGGIRHALLRTGIEVEASNSEYGPGQVEINLVYGPALKMADDTVLFKHIVRQVARQHGLNVTFMAKPYMNEAGNGMHVHQSLANAEGTNLFGIEDIEGPIPSSLMKRYLAGVLAHHKDLQLIATPTINGYKRLADYSFSPTQVTWGLDHRLVGVRSIVEGGAANRLEVRWAAADSNPYLVLTGCLAAGWHGLHEDLPLIDMVTSDPHADDRWERLPGTIGEAVANFEAASFNREAFGDMFVTVFSEMQRLEIASFQAHVTDWELARYRDVI
jgi:glutamine synthetase